MLRVAKSLAHPRLSPFQLPLSRCLQSQRRAAWQSMPLKSQASLINSLPSYHSSELADRDVLNSKTGLQSVDWLDNFRADPANEPVLTAGAMLSNSAKLPPDHIVCMCRFAAVVAAFNDELKSATDHVLSAVLCVSEGWPTSRHAVYV